MIVRHVKTEMTWINNPGISSLMPSDSQSALMTYHKPSTPSIQTIKQYSKPKTLSSQISDFSRHMGALQLLPCDGQTEEIHTWSRAICIGI